MIVPNAETLQKPPKVNQDWSSRWAVYLLNRPKPPQSYSKIRAKSSFGDCPPQLESRRIASRDPTTIPVLNFEKGS